MRNNCKESYLKKMADTFMGATNNIDTTGMIRNLCHEFAKKLELKKV